MWEEEERKKKKKKKKKIIFSIILVDLREWSGQYGKGSKEALEKRFSLWVW